MLIRDSIIEFLKIFIDICQLDIETDDYSDAESIDDFVDYFVAKCPENLEYLKPFVLCFHENFQEPDFLDKTVIDHQQTIFSADVISFGTVDDFKRRYRKFSFTNDLGAFVPIEFIYNNRYVKNEGLVIKIDADNHIAPSTSFIAIINYIVKNHGNNALLELFSLTIKEQKEQEGLLISYQENALISLYSYLYYSFLRTGQSTELDTDHIYSDNTSRFMALPSPILSNHFEQFIEIADVMNEANMSPDILNRYLKFYHQLEYLAYRFEIKKIAKNASEERSFIMDMHKLSGSTMKGGEENTFRDAIFEIFKSRSNHLKSEYMAIPSAKRDELRVLMRQKFGFLLNEDAGDNFLKSLTRLIYKLRNCIVHNKESEFHLTITKIDSYPVLKIFIPFIIDAFEFEIDRLLRAFDDKIKYETNAIKLY